jgi:23S rRNA pseudouridine2605 synthase
LIEGRNREIRRMFEKVGHHVEKIKRVRYGPLILDVPPGKFRSLTLQEVDRLRTACNKPRAETKPSVA